MPKPRFSLRQLLILVTLAALLAVVVLWRAAAETARDPKPRQASRRAIASTQLRKIGVALHHYHEDYGVYPPRYVEDTSGKRLHSWRALLIPYLEDAADFARYDFNSSWDSPINRRFHALPSPFHSPLDSSADNDTSIVALISRDEVTRDSEPAVQPHAAITRTLPILSLKHTHTHWLSPYDAHFDGTQLRFENQPNTRHKDTLGLLLLEAGNVEWSDDLLQELNALRPEQ